MRGLRIESIAVRHSYELRPLGPGALLVIKHAVRLSSELRPLGPGALLVIIEHDVRALRACERHRHGDVAAEDIPSTTLSDSLHAFIPTLSPSLSHSAVHTHTPTVSDPSQ